MPTSLPEPGPLPPEPREGGLSPRTRYLRALASEPVDRAPCWLMRQAGRYLPEYRALRAERSFLDCVHDPALAAELTLQPMRRFPLDAAIVFSDILVVLEAMGLSVEFPAGGPRVTPALSDADPSRLRDVVAERAWPWLAQALRLVREELGQDRALLGFAGAPFTLACYAVEGGGSKDFAAVRALLHGRPDRFDELLRRLSVAVGDLLLLQLRAGADAVQIFDTWGGTLSAQDYRRAVAPHVRSIVDRVHAQGGRVVLFVKDSAHLLDDVLACGADAVGVDWRSDLADVASRAAGRCAVQGNVDPALLLCGPERIREGVLRARAAVGGRTGHVLNLGHGVLPQTPPESVAAFAMAAAAGPSP